MLWLIVVLPVLIFFFGIIVDVSRIWLARVELTNALEAAALSGVKTWERDHGDLSAPRTSAQTAAAANTVIGLTSVSGSSPQRSTVNLELNGGGNPSNNGNADLYGQILLGKLTPAADGARFEFHPDQTPQDEGEFAVCAQKKIQLQSVWNKFFGNAVGPYHISCNAVAVFNAGQPRIVAVKPVVVTP